MEKETMKITSVSRVFRFRNREEYERYRETLVALAKGEVTREALAGVDYDEDAGNIGLKVGIANLWKCAINDLGASPWTSSTALLGVGNGTTPENSDQTGLQGSQTAYAPMDVGFPMPAGQTGMIFQATFPEGVAEFDWHEWCVTNTSGIALNRKVKYRGTKGPDSIWVLQVKIDIN